MGINNIATFFFQNKHREKMEAVALRGHISAAPDLFPRLLSLLLNIVLFNKCHNKWALGKPILSIMLADESSLPICKEEIASTQPPRVHAQLALAFDQLVEDIRPNLEQGNRDRFAQKLATFRTDVLKFLEV